MTETPLCPSCGCTQPNGLLCSEDTAHLETMLAAVPELLEQLDIAISKQARVATGGKSGKGSAHLKSPINWGVVAVRDALLVEVALCGHDINAVRRHPQSAKILARLSTAVKHAYRAIDRARERQYLGTCLYQEGGATCHAEIWVKPGAHQITCTQCDTTHDVTARRASLLEQAADMIVTPREASQYIGEVGGIPIGHQRIRNYLDRGRIAERPSPDSVKRLRLGDLLTVLADHVARHDARAS